jgi:hypothetical protein
MNIGRRAFIRLLGGVAALPVVSKTLWADQKKSDAAALQISRFREFVLPMPSQATEVAPGETRTFEVVAQVAFRPERIIIPANLAISFVVNDIKVNRLTQFEDFKQGPIPAVLFSENTFGVVLKKDTCPPCGAVTITVTNMCKEPRKFISAVIGPAADKIEGSVTDESVRLAMMKRRAMMDEDI